MPLPAILNNPPGVALTLPLDKDKLPLAYLPSFALLKCTMEPRSSLLPSPPPLPRHLVATALGLPLDKWPYLEATLAEMLRFRTEQERTKQTQLRHDAARVALDLVRETERYGLGGEVLKRIFLDAPHEGQLDPAHDSRGDSRSDSRKTPLHTIQPMHPVHDPQDRQTSTPPGQTPLQTPHNHTPRHSPQESHPTPTSHPSHLSHPSHDLAPPLEEKPRAAHLPRAGRLETLPLRVLPQHMYPVYYQVPDKYKPPLDDELYQKYQRVVFHSLPSQYLATPQPLQPHYYINSPPQGVPGLVQLQYVIPPPLGPVMPYQPQEKASEPPQKRAKKGAINFMITTPKNPPAKKYNKS